MNDLIVSPASVLTGWLATYLVHSTVLIGGAWLLTRSTRLLPETRDVLWKTALMAGVVTSAAAVLAGGSGGLRILTIGPPARALASVVSGPDAGVLSSPGGVLDERVAAPVGAVEWTGEWTARTLRVQARVVEVGPECRASLEAEGMGDREMVERARALCTASGASTAARWRWFEGLIALWLAGAVVGVGRLVHRYRIVRDMAGRLERASPRTGSCLADVLDRGSEAGAGQAGSRLHGRALRGLRLRVSDELDGPCVLPGATVVVPRRCERELNDAELRAVLAHEVAHVARRDVRWSTVLRALSALLWVQPLNRLALSASLEAAELVCDDWALLRTGERYGLASSISRVAHWSVGRLAPAPGVSMIGRRTEKGLARRVRRILRGEPRRREPALLRATMAAALVVPMYWLPSVPPPDTTVRALFLARTERIQGDPAAGPTVEFEEVHAVRGVVAGPMPADALLGRAEERRLVFRVTQGR